MTRVNKEFLNNFIPELAKQIAFGDPESIAKSAFQLRGNYANPKELALNWQRTVTPSAEAAQSLMHFAKMYIHTNSFQDPSFVNALIGRIAKHYSPYFHQVESFDIKTPTQICNSLRTWNNNRVKCAKERKANAAPDWRVINKEKQRRKAIQRSLWGKGYDD